jgi:AcrR family transcriptional regulator
MTAEPPAHRRRGAELESSILEAVWAELTETGYSRLTMEGVAARAQTGKQVLYRRWPNRPALVAAAVRSHGGSIMDRVPDTGSLREDAVVLLRHMARRQRELGTELIRGLLLETSDLDPDAVTRMSELWCSLVERAARRGEIGDAPVPARVVAATADLLRYRMLVSAEPATDEMIDELVDEIFLPLIHAHAARG